METQMEEDQDQYDRNLLLSLPSLVSDNVLKYLKGKDLLALRRVCRYGRSWASESSPSAWDSFQIEIRNDCGGWATFDAVVRSGLNVTAIYLNNPGDDGLDIYNSPGISGFMQTYGPHIRKLKVRSFGTFHSDSEFNFFESLPNLRELKIHVLDARNRKILPEGAEPDPIRFPTSFRNMKLLKFGNIMSPMEPPHKTKYHWDLVRACPQLEYLRFPVASQDYDYPELTPEAGLYYEPIMNYMKNQRDSGIPVLKVLDLKYLVSSQDTMMSIAFPSFLCCMHLDFCDPPLFKNAHADMVFDEETNTVPLNLYRECCNISVASLINFTPNIRMLQLPNMTKLVINSTAWSSLSNLYFGEPDWCALKSISILFDGGNPHLSTLTDFIFKSKRRPSVERLSIIFDESVYKDMQLHGLISSRSLARNFENLKFLEMVRWEVKNRSLVRLWEGLKKLEELRVEDCKSFGNAALIGENLAAPAFLRLKKLRKLSLRLDDMPAVTDRAFKDVFSQMKIKEFYLQSTVPLEKVTEAGIRALLEGQFAKSIEKFPFRNWSISSMSFMDFKILGRQFRSIL